MLRYILDVLGLEVDSAHQPLGRRGVHDPCKLRGLQFLTRVSLAGPRRVDSSRMLVTEIPLLGWELIP